MACPSIWPSNVLLNRQASRPPILEATAEAAGAELAEATESDAAGAEAAAAAAAAEDVCGAPIGVRW